MIIDGQQRLTSVLLYCLGVFPDKDIFQPGANDAAGYADENDDEPESHETEEQGIGIKLLVILLGLITSICWHLSV